MQIRPHFLMGCRCSARIDYVNSFENALKINMGLAILNPRIKDQILKEIGQNIIQLFGILDTGMGITSARLSDDDSQRHTSIERSIREDKKKDLLTMKLLLLGTRESGKSTIVKQMRYLHTAGFDNSEIERQRSIIYQNVLCSIGAILKAMREFNIPFRNPGRQTEAAVILKSEENWKPGMSITFHEWACIRLLWTDKGVQYSFERGNEYQLCDSAKYFLDDINRISSATYIPTRGDILRAREGTLGIVELTFTLDSFTLRLIDVGGQRSERKKWIHCFEGVNCVIFVASLSEYNQTLFEDNTMNRMQESLKLFETICNCQWFKNSSMLIFLNKKDLFAQKLKSYPLNACFPEYKGSNQYDDCIKYIEKQYENKNKDPSKFVYTHKTCATDTENIRFVMDASLDIIRSTNLVDAGIAMYSRGRRNHDEAAYKA